VISLILEHRAGHLAKHLFCHHANCWIKKNEKAIIFLYKKFNQKKLIGRQTTIDDLPFSHKIGRMKLRFSPTWRDSLSFIDQKMATKSFMG